MNLNNIPEDEGESFGTKSPAPSHGTTAPANTSATTSPSTIASTQQTTAADNFDDNFVLSTNPGNLLPEIWRMILTFLPKQELHTFTQINHFSRNIAYTNLPVDRTQIHEAMALHLVHAQGSTLPTANSNSH